MSSRLAALFYVQVPEWLSDWSAKPRFEGSNPSLHSQQKEKNMFTIRETAKNIYFMKNHEKVIVFDTQEEANEFVNNFFAYAMPQAMGTDITLVGEVMCSQNRIAIEPLPDEIEFKTINFNELRK